MKAQWFRARAELCRRLLQQAMRPAVREALALLLRESEDAIAAAEFQRRACERFAVPKGGGAG
jgi:hypothetical protein